ncbi:EamA family transporter RarD [Aestuariibacter salexigens]|uniref:EamA family transporter RarD n=1 Tax=Aestuariibacter salexigens TaxID=226010 RepID=UPI0004250C60|nr:EamA family transporter RarD [Aestuariibacter salexigens]
MSDSSAKTGVILAIAAYTIWGFAPLYFKLLQHMPAMEILIHRVVWSAAVLTVLLFGLKHMHKVRVALRSKRVLGILLVAGVLLAANWLLFIWAINNDHLLEASLGYYINPLLNVLLGRVFLSEKLSPLQSVAVAMAVIGVSIMVFSFGSLPWIALTLASSFSVYGLLRKQVAVDSLPGLWIETLMMLPLAIGYWVLFASEASDMTSNSLSINLTLIAAGLITTVPLLCFTGAARRIRYSTLGFFQYIGPTLMFVLAVFLYNEPLQPARLIMFAFVWTGLVLFSIDSLNTYRKNRRLVTQTD